MSEPMVRHNEDTYRVITACVCGRTVSLPDHGFSQYDCPCGRIWRCDGDDLAMYEQRRRPTDG